MYRGTFHFTIEMQLFSLNEYAKLTRWDFDKIFFSIIVN
jgi:hypothetical protein